MAIVGFGQAEKKLMAMVCFMTTTRLSVLMSNRTKGIEGVFPRGHMSAIHVISGTVFVLIISGWEIPNPTPLIETGKGEINFKSGNHIIKRDSRSKMSGRLGKILVDKNLLHSTTPSLNVPFRR